MKEIFNLNLYSDDEIIKIMSPSSNKSDENLGVKVDSETVYSKNNLKFYSLSGKQSANGQVSYIKSYATVVNGKAVSITLHSYSDWFAFQHASSVLRSVVDSVRFKVIFNKPISSSPSGRNDARYKAILGSFSALIIGIPTLLIGLLISKHKKKTAKNKVNLSEAQSPTKSLDNNYDKAHREKEILTKGGWQCYNCGRVNFGYTYVCECGYQKNAPAPVRQLESEEQGIIEKGGWRCECGKINYSYMDTCRYCGLSKVKIDYRKHTLQSSSISGHKNDTSKKDLPTVQNEEEVQRIMNGMVGGQLDRNTATVVYGLIIACERMGDSSLAQIMLPKIQDSLVEQYGIKNLPQIVMRYSYILGTLQGRGILTDEEVKHYNEQQLDYVRLLINSGNTD